MKTNELEFLREENKALKKELEAIKKAFEIYMNACKIDLYEEEIKRRDDTINYLLSEQGRTNEED